MTENYVPIAAAAASLLGSIIMALVAWGWKAEVGTLRAEMRTMQAETRAAIAEAINGFWKDLNGSYVKRDLHNVLAAKVDGLENRVNDLGD